MRTSPVAVSGKQNAGDAGGKGQGIGDLLSMESASNPLGSTPGRSNQLNPIVGGNPVNMSRLHGKALFNGKVEDGTVGSEDPDPCNIMDSSDQHDRHNRLSAQTVLTQVGEFSMIPDHHELLEEREMLSLRHERDSKRSFIPPNQHFQEMSADLVAFSDNAKASAMDFATRLQGLLFNKRPQTSMRPQSAEP